MMTKMLGNSLDYERYTYGKLLGKLRMFYQNEENGIPHRDNTLFDIGNDLANALVEFGSDSNAWKSEKDEFDALVLRLRIRPTVLDIDQAVNSIHQSFLEDDDESALLNYASDFKQYILYRDDVEEGYRSANE